MRKSKIKINYLALIIIGFLIVLIGIQACGGGTGGTGVKAYEGAILTVNHVPLRNAKVTIADSGEFALTDTNGNFTLLSKVFGSSVNFVIEAEDFSTFFTLTDISSESSRVKVELVVDLDSKNVQLTQFSVKAKIIGDCKDYFISEESIQQIIELPSPGSAMCTLEIRVFGDGLLRRKIPVVLQYAACNPNSEWVSDAEAKTGDGVQRGIAKMKFLFAPSAERCRYRLLAPYDYRGFTPISYPIRTLFETK